MKRFKFLIVSLLVFLSSLLLCTSCNDASKSDGYGEKNIEATDLPDTCIHDGLNVRFLNKHPTVSRIEVRIGCDPVDIPVVLTKNTSRPRSTIALVIDIQNVTNYTGYEIIENYKPVFTNAHYDKTELLVESLKLSRQEIPDNGLPDVILFRLDTFPDIWSSSMKYLDSRFTTQEGVLGQKDYGLFQYGLDNFLQNSPLVKDICNALDEVGFICDYQRMFVEFYVYANAGRTFEELNALDDNGVPRTSVIWLSSVHRNNR